VHFEKEKRGIFVLITDELNEYSFSKKSIGISIVKYFWKY